MWSPEMYFLGAKDPKGSPETVDPQTEVPRNDTHREQKVRIARSIRKNGSSQVTDPRGPKKGTFWSRRVQAGKLVRFEANPRDPEKGTSESPCETQLNRVRMEKTCVLRRRQCGNRDPGSVGASF